MFLSVLIWKCGSNCETHKLGFNEMGGMERQEQFSSNLKLLHEDLEEIMEKFECLFLNTLAAPVDPPTIQNSLQCMGIVRVEERKFSRKKIPFKFWYSGLPAMWDPPETGDLAQVAEGRFRVFDQTGEWVPVVAGAMQPYPPLRKYKFVGDDSGWISPRTYQLDQKTWRENSVDPPPPSRSGTPLCSSAWNSISPVDQSNSTSPRPVLLMIIGHTNRPSRRNNKLAWVLKKKNQERLDHGPVLARTCGACFEVMKVAFMKQTWTLNYQAVLVHRAHSLNIIYDHIRGVKNFSCCLFEFETLSAMIRDSPAGAQEVDEAARMRKKIPSRTGNSYSQYASMFNTSVDPPLPSRYIMPSDPLDTLHSRVIVRINTVRC
ncbi:hypothetical protein B0H10DRAFT_1954069 [Mycena sp. CBHHK59/15]|nr:hypothetical protein B0H10DRAFT_1954069 [Mycena sp. CBHHK59/15]